MSENLQTIDTLDPTPFKHFITTLGALPTSFTDSMSYYEMLAWFCDYLQNSVIPAINNNGQAVEELQSLYVELKEYVDNYFENLDVQEEIDTKLDEMVTDGTLRSILNDDLLSDINNRILQNTADISANTSAINNKISEGEADSITMTMLTQDVREALTGGSTAVVGEDSVGTENIKDGAVTFYKLDEYLQDSKILDYGDELDLGVASGGIAIEDGDTHKVTISSPTSTAYSWYKVALTKGKFYSVSSYDYYSSRALIIADSEDNVIWKSDTPTSTSTFTPINKVFRANDTGMYAYLDKFVNMVDSNMLSRNCPSIRAMNSIYNNFNVPTPRKLKTVSDAYTSYTHVTQTVAEGVTLPKINNYSGTSIEIYEMIKGVKYSLSAYSWSGVCGIYILKADNTVIYQSDDSSAGSSYINRTYEFTASENGFITLMKYSNSSYDPSIQIIVDNPFTKNTEVTFSRWYALGDSLTEVNSKASTNYVGYITQELGIESVNLGHSGCGYMTTDDSNNFRTEVQEITGYNYMTDVITVMGSMNDFNHLGADLGELGDTGTDTLYGCMYNFFNDLQTRYVGTRLGVITVPTTYEDYDQFTTRATTYNTALKATAKLFNVPVLDLSFDGNLKPYVTAFRNEFYAADGTGGGGAVDAVHPNSKGHWLIHSKIKEFIKTL